MSNADFADPKNTCVTLWMCKRRSMTRCLIERCTNAANSENDTINPYVEGVCWYGVIKTTVNKTTRRIGSSLHEICGVKGCPLYEIGKPSLGLGTCQMYLCNEHAEKMRNQGFTTKVIENP